MHQLEIRESITLIYDVKSLRNCQSFFIKMIIIFFVISVIIIFSVLAFTLFTPRHYIQKCWLATTYRDVIEV